MASPGETARLNTRDLRNTFLAEDLFHPAELRLLVTDLDRLALGGAMPRTELILPPCAEFGTRYFAERREIGIVNLHGAGHVRVGSERYSLEAMDFLYVGAGAESIAFEACGDSQPCFYFLSCPAHQSLPVARVGRNQASTEWIGTAEHASRRRLSKFIYPGGVSSCQLVMGLTELDAGSVWNTTPPHTHSRRSEVYLYTGLDDGAVLHLMGEPDNTRHLIVHNRQAVLSPSWSVHLGAGTRPYSFIWGMAGENQSFSDMDPVELHQLR